KLSDLFDVRVGQLVAFRDPEEGELYPYFHPKNCPAWGTINQITEERRFLKKPLNPPFIVVKRTSSPRDKYRASATIINLKQPVVIENHMIVIRPKSGLLRDCKKLLKVLRADRTNLFLNK